MSFFKILPTTLLAVAACNGPADPGTGPAPAAQAKPYPLDTCIISGERLGSMGPAVSLVHEGQEVKFCCKSCIKDFQAEPAEALRKLAATAATAAPPAAAAASTGKPHCSGCGHDHGPGH